MALAARKGLPVSLTSAYRTCAEQNRLYAQGRTTPGDIVTKAKCGQSDHNHRIAVDVVPLVQGKASYSVPEAHWQQLGLLGESVGLSWGGRWKTFKDRPHFYEG